MLTAMIKKRSPTVSDPLPAWLQHLLKQCLEFDVTKRPSIPSLLEARQETGVFIANNMLTLISMNVDIKVMEETVDW